MIHAPCLQDQALRVQTAVLSCLWFLRLAVCSVTPRVILHRWQQRSLEGEMWPDARGDCMSEYLNYLPRFASYFLGDVRLSLCLGSYSCINILICTEVFIKVSFMNVRMMIIWLSCILLKCLLTRNVFFFFFLFRGLKDNLARLFLLSKAISHLPWLDAKLFSSIIALLACHSCSQRTSKGMF